MQTGFDALESIGRDISREMLRTDEASKFLFSSVFAFCCLFVGLLVLVLSYWSLVDQPLWSHIPSLSLASAFALHAVGIAGVSFLTLTQRACWLVSPAEAGAYQG